MMIHEITSQIGKHKARRRVGRGRGSGLGKTSGRGSKGQKARAGCNLSVITEGGQMPLFRRIPKRGFNNFNFTTRYSVINVSQLEGFEEGARVDAVLLCEAGLISRSDQRVKILGDGDLNRRLTVVAHKFSRSATQKITSAGGVVEEVK